MTQEQLNAGLNDPGDPYGLASKPLFILNYFAAMWDFGRPYRYELVRRRRLGIAG